MGKILKIGLAVVGVAALVVPGVGAAITGAIFGALSGGTVGTLAAAALKLGKAVSFGLALYGATAGISIITKALGLGPKPPKVSPASQDRLRASLDPRAARKIVFGVTAAATDVGYQEFTGTDQEYLNSIVVNASHELESIDEIWFDEGQAWTSGGGIDAEYTGYLTVTAIEKGTTGNAFTISGSTSWTSSASRMVGCAYMLLRYKLTGNSKKTESPFSSNVTSRITVRCHGALMYDPRLDTTEGGSGSHRADDQTTWAWVDDDTGRNPALQLLWFLLGWRIQNPDDSSWKLAVGLGLPDGRIDLASFQAAANVCDESVTLADASTEPRYRFDGVFSESDDPSLVIENLCASMNAVLRDTGGKLSLTCLTNDLASPVADFTEADVIGEFTWIQTPPLDQSFNIVRGRYTDASDAGLYQLADYPDVSVTAPDGIDRIQQFDLPGVQSASQAQRLAKQFLQRAQYPGTFAADFLASGWACEVGDAVRLTFPALGFSNKLFRVIEHTIRLDGVCPMTLREENAAIYAWSAEENAPVTAAAAVSYDPLNDPFIQAFGEQIPMVIRAAQILSPRNTSDVARELLAATDAGATATISVARHDWDYPDGTADQTRELGTITGLSFSTRYYVYFDDESLEDGSPTYAVATDKADALNSTTNPYRHYVGEIVTLANGSIFDTSSSQQADAANDTTVPGAGQQQGWQISLIRGAQISNFRDASNVARASLIATDVGAVAAISVAKHDWDYGGGRPVVTRAEDTISGLSFSTVYHVYFDDTTLADTSPTYGATTDLATAMPSADRPWRHFVGSIGTPANGDDDITTGQASPVTTNGSLLTGLALSQWVRSAKFDNPRNTSDVARKMLTATDAGATATISVARHDWHYPDGRAVVTRELATITGLSFETIYHVYFDDETLADGSVTYYATTDFLDAENTRAHPWRHFLGSVVTPVNGYDDTSSPGSTAEAQANAASGLNAPITWRSDLKIEVHTTWTGAVKDGRLFKYQITRTEGGQDVSADATWMIDAGSHTATVTDGLVSITTFSPSYESYILVTSIYDGKPEEYLMPVEFIVGPPTPLDGETVVNGDPPCDEGVSGTTYTAFGDVLAAATGANGDTEVRYVCTIFAEAAGHADISLKMQQRTGGGAWGDVASATISAIDFDARFQDGILGGVTYTDTSLSASTVYEYRMLWSQRGTSTATGRIVGKRWAAKSD